METMEVIQTSEVKGASKSISSELAIFRLGDDAIEEVGGRSWRSAWPRA